MVIPIFFIEILKLTYQFPVYQNYYELLIFNIKMSAINYLQLPIVCLQKPTSIILDSSLYFREENILMINTCNQK